MLARASGDPALAVMLESAFILLIEHTRDFVDLALEREFDKIHKAIFEVMIQRRAEETCRPIGEDIMDVMEDLKTFRKNAKVTFD